MELNDLHKKYPHLFQFLIKEFNNCEEETPDKKKVKVETGIFNSRLSRPSPFYKPISKIIELNEKTDDI